ncbi:DUF1670 domain-containing protein [Salicibibacter cibarius]|uniref:DUF1670 domain-containing protein n=1 Tax=Salicibibacter cibarius TaxID=2743000 RepID=A0A7T6Z6D0_9BACI|nr:DUF1670 domain-containing protein [Salicibibacter cibarius]QQK77820.1 DUF1670 domain-containing protein [Salicibibacter cibarius]
MKKQKATQSGFAKRTFRSALMEMLESEYKLIGSHKVIELIADDICQLRDEFYPMRHETSFGNLTWITTSSENEKPKLGQKIEDYKAQRIDLPLVTEEDLKKAQNGIRHGLSGSLTPPLNKEGGSSLEELSLMVNRSTLTVSKRIQEYQEGHQIILPIKGNQLDIGPGVTHKKIIIELYEQQVPPPDIAKRTHHSLEAVDRYIKDYDKVKFLVRRNID